MIRGFGRLIWVSECFRQLVPRPGPGRPLSVQVLKDGYASLVQEAQGMQGKYLPAMREQARTLDAGKVMAMVRGR